MIPRPLSLHVHYAYARIPSTSRSSVMPPKEKKRKIEGQQTLQFRPSGLHLGVPTDSGELPSTSAAASAPSTPSTVRRGSLDSWRSFAQAKYLEKHPWLVLKPDGIYCQYCSTHQLRAGASVFLTSPYTGNRSDKLLQHERSIGHQESLTRHQESLLRSVTSTTISEVVRQAAVVTADEAAFSDALRCMYFLMKREIAHTTNFAELQALCVLLGNTTLPTLQKAKNLNYLSKQTMGEMVAAIGLALEADILKQVRSSPYYSIIIDEATDISVTKSLGLCIQYLDPQANVSVRALKLIEIRHGTAEFIAESIFDYLSKSALDLSKLAGGACDGASVMTGPLNGVVARIKVKVPQFLATHCVAHRLSLAAVNACVGSSLVSHFQALINQIYSFFSRSSVHTQNLKEIEKAVNDPQLKMSRATETRWLSHQHAVDALRRSIVSVKIVLEQESVLGNATALGLSIHLKKPTFIATLLVLSDVLSVLGNLSRCFQSNSLNLLSVEDLVRDCKSALNELKEYPLQGGYSRDLSDVLASLEISEALNEATFIPQVQSYLAKLIANIEQRFPQLHIISLFGYLDPRNTHLGSPGAMLELAEHFQIDGAKLWAEFLVYKSFATNVHIPSGLTPIEVVSRAILEPTKKDTMSTLFPLISDLLARLIVLPAASAQVERVFSSMKRIKTAQRNRLNTTTLDHLILVSMEGPTVTEWDPHPALRLWESWGNRKLETSTD